MAADPKTTPPDAPRPGSAEWDEQHYGDTEFDPDIAEKVSPAMKEWLAGIDRKPQEQP